VGLPEYVWSSLEKRKDGPEFDQVLEMVRTINKLEMEVCCTLVSEAATKNATKTPDNSLVTVGRMVSG
jgi:biotin synthase-like enzyme